MGSNMKPGTKPKPLKVKLLEGRRVNRKLKDGEPEPAPGRPTCPDHLSVSAKWEWKRIVPELEAMGLISKVDMAVLAGYCQYFGEWKDTCKLLKGKSPIVLTKSNNVIQNPLLGVAHKAYDLMCKSAVEFGLTPSSRTRINVNNANDPEDPMDKAIREAEQRRKN